MSTTQTSLPLAAGTRLGDFEITGVSGQTRYTNTYLAMDAVGAEVLVKEFLPAEFALREDGLVRAREAEDRTPLRFWLRGFLDKALLLQKLNHPGLIRVLRQFEANGTGYYVTERIAGESLEAIVEREGTLGEAQLRRLLAPVLAGLEQAHAAGLVHRNIRPQNLILRSDDSVVLSDFGELRAPIRFKGRTVFSAGTPPYAAPEEFYIAGPIGPWTDVYALGATACRVLTGRSPPDACSRTTGPAFASLAASAQVKCSDALIAAVDSALQLDVEQRPQSVAAWRAALLGEGGEPPEQGIAAPASHSLQASAEPRSKLPLLIGAVLAATAAAGGYVLLWQHGSTEIPAAAQSAAAARADSARPVAVPATASAAAPVPQQADLERLALDLMAKEKKLEDAQKQLQMQHEAAVQEVRTAAAASSRSTSVVSAAPAAPTQEEVEAAEHLKQLQADVEKLRQEKAAQEAQVAVVSPAGPPPRVDPDWPAWYQQATGSVRQKLRYPRSSLEAGEEGNVLVKLRVRRDGTIVGTDLQQSSSFSALNDEAVDVIARVGRFAPLPGDYQPNSTEVDITIPINFKLQQ